MVFGLERIVGNFGESLVEVRFAAAYLHLMNGKDSQIFENMTVPDVIKEVLERGLQPFGRKVKFNLSRKYHKREYCVQYQETDGMFVQRLMQSEGLNFYFDQSGDKELLVMVDCNDAFPLADLKEEKKKVEPPKEEYEETWSTAGRCAADASNVFQLVVLDGNGDPVSRDFTVTTPNGITNKCRTNHDGMALMPVSKFKHCEVDVHKLHDETWKTDDDEEEQDSPEECEKSDSPGDDQSPFFKVAMPFNGERETSSEKIGNEDEKSEKEDESIS